MDTLCGASLEPDVALLIPSSFFSLLASVSIADPHTHTPARRGFKHTLTSGVSFYRLFTYSLTIIVSLFCFSLFLFCLSYSTSISHSLCL